MTIPAVSAATNPVTPAGAAAAANTPATTGATGSSPSNSLLAPNQFLSLLVDSLKYQDPLDPTSSADFLQQLASLSQVQTESQVAQTDQTSAAANLIGHTVTGANPLGVSVTGTVTGFTMTANGPNLTVGNDTVSLGTVTSVGPVAPAGVGEPLTALTPNPTTTAPATTEGNT